MALVKYFHSELPGAPVLSGTAGSRIAVLDACLVSGWGLLTATAASVTAGVCTVTFAGTHSFEPLSVALIAGAGPAAVNGEQRITATSTNTISFAVSGVADGAVSGTITAKLAPAGWVKLSGTNKAAYKSGNPSASQCWARIDDTGTTYARIRAYETMSDVDTGTGPTPTDAQNSGGLYVGASNTGNLTQKKWIVVADDKRVWLLIARYSAYTTDYEASFFGDFPSLKAGDAYNFALVAETADVTSASSVGAGAPGQKEATAGVYIMRSYSQLGASIPAMLRKPGLEVQSGSVSLPTGPNPINNGIEVCPTLLFEQSGPTANRRGELPGLYGIPHSLGSAYDSKSVVSSVAGLPGHSLLFVRYLSSAATNGYRYAIDLGPWE